MHVLPRLRAAAIFAATSLFVSPASSEEVTDFGASAELRSPAVAAAVSDVTEPVTLLFFWREGCPHCEAAKPMVEALAKEHPDLRVELVEVRRDPGGVQRFVETMRRLGTSAEGVPTFVVGDAYVVGYEKGETDARVRALVEQALESRS